VGGIQYNGRIRSLQAYIQHQGKPTLTMEMFAEYLSTIKAQTHHASKSTAEGYRAAILFHQRTYGTWTEEGCWADTWACKKLVAGYGYEGKTQQRPQRGTLTHQMFADMLNHARTHHRPFAAALELGYRLALRPHQVIGLQHGDYDGFTVLVPDKRSKATNNFPQHTFKTVVDENAHWILTTLTALRPGRFFEFNEHQLRRVFKSIAARLGWTNLMQKYDGPHCLRHGGMAHLNNILQTEGVDDNTRNKVLQVSEKTRRHYTKPNEQRV
jgi:hypothetical protein